MARHQWNCFNARATFTFPPSFAATFAGADHLIS